MVIETAFQKRLIPERAKWIRNRKGQGWKRKQQGSVFRQNPEPPRSGSTAAKAITVEIMAVIMVRQPEDFRRGNSRGSRADDSRVRKEDILKRKPFPP